MPIESLSVLPQPGRPEDPEEMRKVQEDYCRMRGYDPETGVPTREALVKLGLQDVADKIESVSGTIP
jgi:aldehyde:ferredoxin oxidoreductase